MKIQFNQLEYAHEILSSFDPDKSKEDDYDEVDGTEIEKRKIILTFPWVELDAPLISGSLDFSRTESTFSSRFWISSGSSYAFSNLSQKMGSKIENWYPTNKNGCGYILDKDENPIIVITRASKPETRILALGVHGAQERKFGDYGDFVHWMGKLEKTTNILLNSCLENLLSNKKLKEVPTRYVHVTP